MKLTVILVRSPIMQVLVFLVGLLLFHTICFHLALQSFDQVDRLEQVDLPSPIFFGAPRCWNARPCLGGFLKHCQAPGQRGPWMQIVILGHICNTGRHAQMCYVHLCWEESQLLKLKISCADKPPGTPRAPATGASLHWLSQKGFEAAAAMDVFSLENWKMTRKLHWQLYFWEHLHSVQCESC